VVVPHQGEPFAERVRTEHHAVDPPRLEPLGLAGSVSQLPGGLLEPVGSPDLAGEEAVDAGRRTVLHVALDLGPTSREARPAVQVDDAAQVPGGAGIRAVRGPGSVARVTHRRTPS